jgi:hypothetical protein
VLSLRWRGVTRPAVVNGDSAPPASSASGKASRPPGVDGIIWCTVHHDPGRYSIYRPGRMSSGPLDVRRADGIDPTGWARRGGFAVWARRKPNYGGPNGPSARFRFHFRRIFILFFSSFPARKRICCQTPRPAQANTIINDLVDDDERQTFAVPKLN